VTFWLLFAGLNLLAFLVFGWDKLCATRKRSRVPERQLLAVAFVGGALGAMIGQQVFRHKTAKQPFRALLWMAAMLNIVVIGWAQFSYLSGAH